MPVVSSEYCGPHGCISGSKEREPLQKLRRLQQMEILAVRLWYRKIWSTTSQPMAPQRHRLRTGTAPQRHRHRHGTDTAPAPHWHRTAPHQQSRAEHSTSTHRDGTAPHSTGTSTAQQSTGIAPHHSAPCSTASQIFHVPHYPTPSQPTPHTTIRAHRKTSIFSLSPLMFVCVRARGAFQTMRLPKALPPCTLPVI